MIFSPSPVSSRWLGALLMPAVVLSVAPAQGAQSEEEGAYMGEDPDGYAALRILEGDATIRKGELEEPLSRGVPVAEGDVVESRGRGVLQLADGTRVAFGPGTRFQTAALLRDLERGRQVLLRLDEGRLRIASGRQEEVRVRIDTPAGSCSLAGGASVDLQVGRDGVTRVAVRSGRAIFFNERDRASLAAGERLAAADGQDRLDRIQAFNTYGSDAFEAWCDRNMEVRRGPSWDRVPEELCYYSDDLDAHGEWIYVDDYQSWCWRPRRVSSDWRPYWQGRWAAYPGGMTWVSTEPWGYVTYHHGRWGWGARLGWFWIPGVYYAPAWVAWQSDTAYFGWAPLGFNNAPVPWGYGAWAGAPCWNIVDIHVVFSDRAHAHTHHDRDTIHHFEPGPGWHGPVGPKPPPWHRGPLLVDPHEFRDPARFQKTIRMPGVFDERLRDYAHQTGRTVYRRPPSLERPAGPSAPPPSSANFEDRSRLVREHEPRAGSNDQPEGPPRSGGPVFQGSGPSRKPGDKTLDPAGRKPSGPVVLPPPRNLPSTQGPGSSRTPDPPSVKPVDPPSQKPSGPVVLPPPKSGPSSQGPGASRTPDPPGVKPVNPPHQIPPGAVIVPPSAKGEGKSSRESHDDHPRAGGGQGDRKGPQGGPPPPIWSPKDRSGGGDPR